MEIIENSNVVDWEKYPNSKCAILFKTFRDYLVEHRIVMPKYTEFMCVADKLPVVIGMSVHIVDTQIWYIDGIVPTDREHRGEDISIIELHIRPGVEFTESAKDALIEIVEP